MTEKVGNCRFVSRKVAKDFAGRGIPISVSACLLLIGFFLFTACSTRATFKKAPTTGRISGDPHLVWIAPNTFLFYQPPGQESFSFTTHLASEKVDPAAPGRGRYRHAGLKITPGMMITTGASVPRSLWLAKGLSPWDYAQAAIIHDWLFEAHHRYLAGEKGYEQYKDITLDDAADIFAECIRKNMFLGSRRTAFIHSQQEKHPGDPAWKDIQQAFPDNRESPFALWAYHYAVSPDCIAPAARNLWQSRQNDIALCRTILTTQLGSRAFRKQIEELLETNERVTQKLEGNKHKTQRAKPSPQATGKPDQTHPAKTVKKAPKSSASAAGAPILPRRIRAAFNALTAGRNGLKNALGPRVNAKVARDAADAALRARMSALIRELASPGLLTPDDDRWYAYGLVPPAGVERPGIAPDDVHLRKLAPTVALAAWSATPRAHKYRPFIQVVGRDADFIEQPLTSETDITFENLPTNGTLKFYVQGTNPAGDSPKSAVVEVVLG